MRLLTKAEACLGLAVSLSSTKPAYRDRGGPD